jgi:putative ATP-binding cassette transporter
MVAPLIGLLSSVGQLSRGLAAVRRIRRFNIESEPEHLSVKNTRMPDWKSVTLEGVCYSYDENENERPAIGPIDVTISRGEVVFVVGGNGSGKTTLLLLLAGLITPIRGNILLDQQQIRSIKWQYRAMLSVVFCDFHVFEHLLDEKGELAEGESVERLISRLGLQNVIEVSEAKLSKTDVSAGQRKRLAILQLLLEDRNVLILDEIAADLDPEFKRYFYEHLLVELRASGKTVVLATHDAEYFRCADRLLRLEGGLLVGHGQQTC